MSERDELAKAVFVADNYNANDDVTLSDWEALVASDGDGSYAHRIAQGLIQAGYRKPRTITTAEELDALPVGSVVHSEKYIHHANGMQISFQRWDDGLWHRGARSSDTHPDYFLPATVLWEPR